MGRPNVNVSTFIPSITNLSRLAKSLLQVDLDIVMMMMFMMVMIMRMRMRIVMRMKMWMRGPEWAWGKMPVAMLKNPTEEKVRCDGRQDLRV